MLHLSNYDVGYVGSFSPFDLQILFPISLLQLQKMTQLVFVLLRVEQIVRNVVDSFEVHRFLNLVLLNTEMFSQGVCVRNIYRKIVSLLFITQLFVSRPALWMLIRYVSSNMIPAEGAILFLDTHDRHFVASTMVNLLWSNCTAETTKQSNDALVLGIAV